MAHFAEIDTNNEVLRVLVVDNENVMDENGNESEEIGIKFLQNIFGEDTKWVQTSYNSNFRFRYAGIEMIYDEKLDVFLPPKPYQSWVLNNNTYDWDSPIPEPELTEEQKNEKAYYEWNEELVDWELKYLPSKVSLSEFFAGKE